MLLKVFSQTLRMSITKCNTHEQALWASADFLSHVTDNRSLAPLASRLACTELVILITATYALLFCSRYFIIVRLIISYIKKLYKNTRPWSSGKDFAWYYKWILPLTLTPKATFLMQITEYNVCPTLFSQWVFHSLGEY